MRKPKYQEKTTLNIKNQCYLDNTMAKRKRAKGQTTIYKTYTYNFFHPY
jgi:hypothetical protein